MIGKKFAKAIENSADNVVTVNGQKYFVLFTEGIDAKKKGKLLRNIRNDIRQNGTFYQIGEKNHSVFVTPDEEVYHRMVRAVETYEQLRNSAPVEKTVQGYHFDFVVRSNVEYEGRLLPVIINIESTLYETANNIISAEHVAQCITNADLVKMELKKNCVNTFVLYLVFDR